MSHRLPEERGLQDGGKEKGDKEWEEGRGEGRRGTEAVGRGGERDLPTGFAIGKNKNFLTTRETRIMVPLMDLIITQVALLGGKEDEGGDLDQVGWLGGEGHREGEGG
jgi:hypothetical protein